MLNAQTTLWLKYDDATDDITVLTVPFGVGKLTPNGFYTTSRRYSKSLGGAAHLLVEW